jgi:hypothetical protein
LLVYSARAQWSYTEQVSGWTRYNAFPHNGLTFIIFGGLKRGPESRAGLSQRQNKIIVGTVITLFLINLPRGVSLGLAAPDDDYTNLRRRVEATNRSWQVQMDTLRRIEAVDALCREHHIDAATARKALPPWVVPEWGLDSNGWKLLRGSTDARPISVVEARRLLLAPFDDIVDKVR